VWDARSGRELKEQPIPPTPWATEISPDGRWLARQAGKHVELIPLQADEEELAYRSTVTRPNRWWYRQHYEAARAANDDFVARFYLNLLPLRERTLLEAQVAADREVAAGRTPDALVRFVTVSATRPDDTSLALKVAALQAWFGKDRDLADTCGRALDFAKVTYDPVKWDQMAWICCLRPTRDNTRLEAALALARKAAEVRRPYFPLILGMAEYRSDHLSVADFWLTSATKNFQGNLHVTGTSAFYQAMILFRQGKQDEARRVAATAAAKMKPLPKDEKNPLANDANTDDLALWMAYKEAKAMIQFDAAHGTPADSNGKWSLQ
jgi:hypothetical protein